MKRNRSIAVLFAVAVLAAAFGASRASAQEFHGKFTLPFAARWGTANLPPGNYTLKVSHTPVGQGRVEVRSEDGPQAFAFSVTGSASPSVSKNVIFCIRQGSAGIVRALQLGPLGETMYFHVPKGTQLYVKNRSAKKHALLAQAPELLERVPVVASGK